MSATGVIATPVCDECATELHRVGRGEHQYWTCRYCGTITPVR